MKLKKLLEQGVIIDSHHEDGEFISNITYRAIMFKPVKKMCQLPFPHLQTWVFCHMKN